mmetsp:Transcript_17231/g.51566  ORF Transcript_17231/g.51566 Transcript_17231/m.51566 type:complete len:235 (-) Transcript_17231:3820-4524(-)
MQPRLGGDASEQRRQQRGEQLILRRRHCPRRRICPSRRGAGQDPQQPGAVGLQEHLQLLESGRPDQQGGGGQGLLQQGDGLLVGLLPPHPLQGGPRPRQLRHPRRQRRQLLHLRLELGAAAADDVLHHRCRGRRHGARLRQRQQHCHHHLVQHGGEVGGGVQQKHVHEGEPPCQRLPLNSFRLVLPHPHRQNHHHLGHEAADVLAGEAQQQSHGAHYVTVCPWVRRQGALLPVD